MLEFDLACPDWEDRIRAGKSLVPDLPLDEIEAARACAIFNKLRLPDVAGKPALAEAGGDWFRDIVRALFGSLDPATKRRAIREIFLLAPKKSSKTSYAAALMVTAVLMNLRPRAEFLLIAPTKMIADLAFSQAVGMIEADPYLKSGMRVQEHLRIITDVRDESKGGMEATLKIKTFNSDVLTGVKPVGALVDELHEIAKDPAAARIIGQLRGGLLPNPEAFFCFITTQADQPPAGVFRSELMAARMTRDGKTKGATLPILYEFPADIVRSGAWRDSQNWWMVTPNRNRSVTIDRLVEDFKKAELSGEGEVRRWASQHLNLEIGLALRSDRWAGADHWEACAESGLTLDVLIERCESIVIGIDGGGLDDLLAATVLGREKETKKWLVWSHAWAAEIALDRRKSEAARYRDFERAGDLTIVPALGEDIKAIGDLVEQLDESGKLVEKAAIGVDPVGIGQIIDELAARDIDPSRILGVPQGYKLNGAIKTVERALAEKSLCHAGQPLMAWAVSNAKVEPRGNAISITKQASGTAKIDPLMALFNAAALMAMNPTNVGRSYLETDDLIII